MKVLGHFLFTMRPRQALLKNGVVFATIVFARKLGETDSLLRVLVAYAVFVVLSGVIYILNDVKDAERDRLHPDKKDRPLASGDLSKATAMVGAFLLMAGALTVAFWYDGVVFGLTAASYVVLFILYTLVLKYVVIIDVIVIAFGFILRVVAGGVVLKAAVPTGGEPVEISSWLIICSLFLALFLALSKRRYEIVSLGDDAGSHRKILFEYSPELLDQMIAVVTSGTLISYILYSMDKAVHAKLDTPYLGLTIPFVLYGIFRYFYLVQKRGEGGNPARVLVKDVPLLVNVALWVGTVVVLLYTNWVDRIIDYIIR